MNITLALIGNQNCGKTTLFNQLTGSNQHVGNFPGVTVERKSGFIKQSLLQSDKAVEKNLTVEVVDLPGIYSLSPYTPEEIVTRDFLTQQHPDAILNIVDSTNIERNLYLSLQLAELNVPMVVALNMMDEVTAAGNSIDVIGLQKKMGIDAVPISAVKGDGISELVDRITHVAINKRIPQKIDFCDIDSPVHQAIHSMAHLISDHAAARNLPLRYCATKLIEGDELMIDTLNLNRNEQDILGHIVREMEAGAGTDQAAAIADMRYSYITRLTQDTVTHVGETVEQKRSVKIDNILTHRIWGIPIFLGIMALIFYLTFGLIGKYLSDLFSRGIDWVTAAVDYGLTAYGLSAPAHSLIIDGAFAGIGSVLSFMPTILVLFFFLALLEDTGYMARVAFVMDTALRKIGLSGKSFVPMLLGFGCSVPAIMSTRTLSSQRDKRMTVFIIPFMSCSAKLPVYSLLTAAFFPEHAALVMVVLYLTGFAVAIISALLLKNTAFTGKPVPFVLELPAYRMPGAKSIWLNMWGKAKDFMRKAFTIIFAATIVIWFLQHFDIRLNLVADTADSMLAQIGSFISPIFYPLGFRDWRLSTALLTGLTAKETVVSTLAILTGASGAALQAALQTLLTPVSAFSFLIFTLLYMPCVAAFAVTKREIGTRLAVTAMIFQTATAWVYAFLIYHLLILF
ncbi:MAG: ferrous iron transport protein B [Treponema sp.]|jgi:ferrous iron transport protein B|nr:ferrous iron transport protein B [Treponema sp.]